LTQVVTVVTEGGRLEVPARADLPGPDTASFEGLDAYVALMRRCWAHNPNDRPTFQEIIAELRDLLAAQVARGPKGAGGVGPGAHPVALLGAGDDTPTRGGGATPLLGTTPPSARSMAAAASAGARSPLGAVPEGAAALPPVNLAAELDATGLPSDGLERGDSMEVAGSLSLPGSPYASTAAQTGSILRPEDLKGWGTRGGA
jgi:hypothetical protein